MSDDEEIEILEEIPIANLIEDEFFCELDGCREVFESNLALQKHYVHNHFKDELVAIGRQKFPEHWVCTICTKKKLVPNITGPWEALYHLAIFHKWNQTLLAKVC